MTANPNPSPELRACPFCGHDDPVVYPTGDASKTVQGGCRNPDCILFDCFPGNFTSRDHFAEWWNTRTLSPQTLPAPGEVEAVAASASIALMYLQTGFIECPQCGEEVPTKDLDATHELATVVQPAPITGAPTVATVAAANDEGVQKAIAGVLLCELSLDPDRRWDIAGTIAAAIHLLSQGGGKE